MYILSHHINIYSIYHIFVIVTLHFCLFAFFNYILEWQQMSNLNMILYNFFIRNQLRFVPGNLPVPFRMPGDSRVIRLFWAELGRSTSVSRLYLSRISPAVCFFPFAVVPLLFRSVLKFDTEVSFL